MSYTWNGPAGKGAMKTHRQKKRDEAEARNDSGKKLLAEVFEQPTEEDSTS